MTDITIPPEALEAAAQAIFDASPFREEEAPFHEQSEQYQALTRAYARAAILAMLKAWPGMIWHPQGQYRKKFGVTHLILPLPQDASNPDAREDLSRAGSSAPDNPHERTDITEREKQMEKQ